MGVTGVSCAAQPLSFGFKISLVKILRIKLSDVLPSRKLALKIPPSKSRLFFKEENPAGFNVDICV